MKRCTRCERALPFDAFNRATRASDGRRCECRICQQADAAPPSRWSAGEQVRLTSTGQRGKIVRPVRRDGEVAHYRVKWPNYSETIHHESELST